MGVLAGIMDEEPVPAPMIEDDFPDSPIGDGLPETPLDNQPQVTPLPEENPDILPEGALSEPPDTGNEPPTPEPDAPVDELQKLKEQLLAMDAEQLKKYAKENSIDIGNATSQQGIFKKIAAYLDGQEKVPDAQ